jgi:hypothetical protein
MPDGCRFTNNLLSWTLVSFALAMEHKFDSDDCHLDLTELTTLRKIGTVKDYATLPALFEGSLKKEDYATCFEALLFQVHEHQSLRINLAINTYDGLFFVSHLTE